MPGAIGKADRLLELEMLLATHPEGMRKAEIAERLGVDRSTAGRYIIELTGLIPLVEEDDGRLWIDRSRYLRLVRLSPQEIESIRLAFRLFRRKIRLPFPHAAAALRALALAAERASPALSRGLAESADSLDARAFPRFTRRYQQTMERLIEASAAARTVIIRHRSRRRGEVDEYRFQPYCLEPYPDGNSLHAIGFCPELAEMRTFKLERIESVRLTDELFEMYPRIRGWGADVEILEPIELRERFLDEMERVREMYGRE